MNSANNPGTQNAPAANIKRRFRVPIAAALVGGVALLLSVAVGSVLMISQVSAQRITLELLGDNADIGLELLETRVRGQLEPAHVLGLQPAKMFADGTVDPGDRRQLEDTFRGALAAVPQATALIFIDSNYQSYQYPPSLGSLEEVVAESQFTAGLQGMEQMIAGARDMAADFVWMAPIWVQSLEQPGGGNRADAQSAFRDADRLYRGARRHAPFVAAKGLSKSTG